MDDLYLERLRLIGQGDQLQAEREELIAQGADPEELVEVEFPDA